MFVSRTSRIARRRVDELDERLVRVGVLDRAAQRVAQRLGQGHVARSSSSPWSTGTRCGTNVTPSPARPAAASSWSISGVWRWRADPVGGDVLVDGHEVRAWRSARGPAPETPVLASITTSAQVRRASGASASIAAVGKQPGLATSVGAGDLRRGSAPAARRRPRAISSGAGCGHVVALVDGEVAQAEVGAQVDDLHPALAQRGDDRRGRAVRVGDDRGVGLDRRSRRAPRASAARGGAGRARRAGCPRRCGGDRASARSTGGAGRAPPPARRCSRWRR